ncbi:MULTISPECIES: helix-turn-helix domain-containing protein [unclassified Avibacterium]|uniref:helix-turn-helix domain-containing protein n=1 Tax=unclassified Avibacterium TaxID=2685287 RepID=UPI0020275217|nr:MULTISPECIES: helix-turn-helix transcriptional regulator [unclassified Avibacterium]URL01473.1 helix-turn-helix domain-containing protein [Avibacterium sp. 20-126]MCW9699529.1 helix-turn-helix domain-containing protein [Avibacterium sp. 20-129]MCW9717918.1 helix-turn-helix domain-containing protein [Avibacterium sp. 21-599]MCW9733546.1 helix-turn-helix domain-containing protein [Avibacterium sp. 20-15]URL03404.1 helix-turn-helix domain-containing protein [Avibacterium sp. 20-132]
MLDKDEQLLLTIGQAIAKYRQAVGLTQAQLAEILDISNDAVSRMERGKSVPNILRLLELSEIFHCEIADLLTSSSNRSMDQARQLEQLLHGLDSYERAELITIIERMLKWKAYSEK